MEAVRLGGLEQLRHPLRAKLRRARESRQPFQLQLLGAVAARLYRDTQALSALENIVHFRKGQTPPSYAFLSAAFDESLVSVLVGSLPSDWPSKPLLTAALGDKWYDSRASCILAVPTALVPNGTNYLINATHPGFSEVKVGPPIPYSFDARIAAMTATPGNPS